MHWDCVEGTYLLTSFAVLRQLDLAHAARANGLAKGPCSCAGRCNGRPALGDGHGLSWSRGLGGYAVGRHCAGCRGVRSIARMAPARVGARRGSFARLAVTRRRVGGDVALLVVAAGDVLEMRGVLGVLGMAAGAGGGALRAGGSVDVLWLLRASCGGAVAGNGRRGRGRCSS